MTITHYLVTDSTAVEVERRTGLRGHDTPFGVLVEKPKPFRIDVAMAAIERAFNPSRCICGKYAVMHQANCPMGMAVT